MLKQFLLGLFLGQISLFNLTLPAQDSVDQISPDVLTGFKEISESDLQDGWVHLFDGKTVFGWEIIPLKKKKNENVSDPIIKITQGEMRINTQTPIRLKTPLFMGNAPNLTIDFRVESAVCQVLIQGIPLDEYQTTVLRRGMNGGFSTKQIAFDNHPILHNSPQQNIVSQSFAEHFDNYLAIDILKGTFVIESVRYCPNAKKHLNFRTDESGDWLPQNDNLKIELIDNQTFRLFQQGHLETKESFDHFCVQLEYQTLVDLNNRDKTFCNSGLFFRSIPQSSLDGYECQINNVPNPQDREKFLGNDSGSIFRHAAARRLTNRENEWTYLTVSAVDATFRTWINGIPAVVWTDKRKKDENPRKGCRIEKGTIQLQGHDPWTNIIFRNIRIATPNLNDIDSQ
ncbi:MAG: DUF1080 domain-containing protein [Planctomycetia bacterium]|nr:DUF1080 domain-containing protein [Planctomycetia bacterium]